MIWEHRLAEVGPSQVLAASEMPWVTVVVMELLGFLQVFLVPSELLFVSWRFLPGIHQNLISNQKD